MLAALAVFVLGIVLFFVLPAAEILTRDVAGERSNYDSAAERGELRRRM